MNSVEEINELRKFDILTAKKNSLDKSINDSMHALALFETMQEKLCKQHQELNQEIDDLEITNQKYLDSSSKVPHYREEHKNLEFFDQMKILEAETEYIDATLEARKKNIAVLKSNLASNQALLKRLQDQIHEQTTALEQTQKEEDERQSTIKMLKQKICEADDSYSHSSEACESLKEEIKNQAEEMKTISPEAMEMLVLQKDTLVDVVRKAKEEKRKLKQQRKHVETKCLVQDNMQQKRLDKEASPLVWMSERNSLLIKIKKAQQELTTLNQRDRSANKAKDKNAQKIEDFPITEEDVRKALLLELRELEAKEDLFLEEAIETEKNYREELKKQIAEIEATSESINSFKDNALLLMKQQNTIVSGTERLDLLRKELQELKSKL